MNCKNCGNKIDGNYNFCPYCGSGILVEKHNHDYHVLKAFHCQVRYANNQRQYNYNNSSRNVTVGIVSTGFILDYLDGTVSHYSSDSISHKKNLTFMPAIIFFIVFTLVALTIMTTAMSAGAPIVMFIVPLVMIVAALIPTLKSIGNPSRQVFLAGNDGDVYLIFNSSSEKSEFLNLVNNHFNR